MTDATAPPQAAAPAGGARTDEARRALAPARRTPVPTEIVEWSARPPWHAR